MNLKYNIGKVIEIFIPDNDIESKQIGFKVLIDGEELNVIQEQDEYNSKILKNDLVVVTKQILKDEEYIDIESYEGEDYE